MNGGLETALPDNFGQKKENTLQFIDKDTRSQAKTGSAQIQEVNLITRLRQHFYKLSTT